MTQFQSLLKEIEMCTICSKDLPLGPRPVLQFHPKAKLLIAGQAPGKKVHQSGIPFDDASGDRLRQWLGINNSVFYDPEQVAILPMGFCYPGKGPSGDLPPRPECAPTWREKLLKQLPNLKMTIVSGKYAINYHFKTNASLTEIVKNWGKFWPAVVPLPHPSPRNNIWLSKNQWFESEFLPLLKRHVRDVLDIHEK